jgi:Domain of unknown function (DUF4440)
MFAALLIPAISFSQITEQAKVNNTIVAMFKGLADLSIEQIRNSSTDDLIILEHGEVWNMDTIVVKLNEIKALNPVRVNSFDFIKTEVRDQTAWVAYHNKAIITVNGQKVDYHWLESAVLVKQGNDWKVKMLQSTRLLPKKD